MKMKITNEIWKLKSVLMLVFENDKTKNGNRKLEKSSDWLLVCENWKIDY